MLREELQLLQEPGSYVGEVTKVMGRKKVLVKVCGRHPSRLAPSLLRAMPAACRSVAQPAT